jgi:uncharacterized protein (DUF1330 family)
MASKTSVTMVDIHRVTDLKSARDYVKWADGVAKRNGVDVLQVFEIAEVRGGQLKAEVVFLSSAPSENEFAALTQDAEYLSRSAERDSIFEMSKMIRYSVAGLVAGREDIAKRLRAKEKASWPTMLDLHNVNDVAMARDYARWLDGVASRHGVELLQIYEVVGTPKGTEAAAVVFLLRAPSPAAFVASVEDPEYVARVPQRNQTFRMDEVRRFVVKPLLVSGTK